MSGLSIAVLPDDEAVLAKAPAENFPVGLRVLPRELRESLFAVYCYARLVDDVGDEGEVSPGDRLAALDEVEAELARTFDGNPRHPVFVRLAGAIKRHSLDRRPFSDLIEANRMDQQIDSYETFDQLLGYCRLSANPVGRLVLAVFGETGEEKERLSDLVCSGLQLVEHLQDVAEDADRHRRYLPQEDLDRFNVPANLLAPPVERTPAPESFRRMMALQVTRTRSMIEEGSVLVSQLGSFAARLAVAGFAGGGLAQLSAIERAGYDVLARQLKASKTSVATSLVALAVRGRARR